MVLTKNNLYYILLFKSQQGRRKWCFAAQFRIYPSTNLHQRFPSLIVFKFKSHSPIECLRNFISLVSFCKNKMYFTYCTCKSVNSVMEFLFDCGSKFVWFFVKNQPFTEMKLLYFLNTPKQLFLTEKIMMNSHFGTF